MTELAKHQACRSNVGEFIRTKIPKGEYVASSDLGTIFHATINNHFAALIALTSSDVLEN